LLLEGQLTSELIGVHGSRLVANTALTYRTHLRAWTDFSERMDFPPWPVTTRGFALFAAYRVLCQGLMVSYVWTTLTAFHAQAAEEEMKSELGLDSDPRMRVEVSDSGRALLRRLEVGLLKRVPEKKEGTRPMRLGVIRHILAALRENL